MRGTIDVPEEGLKIIAVAGYINGNPIWKELGRLVINKNSNPTVLIDRTFNPAGTVVDDPSIYLTCPVKPFSKEELDRKAGYKRESRNDQRKRQSNHSSNFNDMDDDIPF